MATLNTVKDRVAKKILVYGASGAGKTLAVGKLAEKYKLIWLDGENGWETLLQLDPEWQARVELLRIPDTKDLPMFSETVTKIVTGAKCMVDDETGKVNHPLREKQNRPYTEVHMAEADENTILVIDSLTQLVASVTFAITRGRPDDYKLDWDDWGNLGTVMTKILTYIQAAKFHVVVISHEQMVEQIDKTDKIVPVGGTRNFSRNTGKFFSDVVYMEIKNRKHTAATSTTYSNKISTKSRTDVALEKTEEVKLLDLF